MDQIPLVSFAINRKSTMSLQKQIQSIIVEGVFSGKFRAGARIPSSRALANFLGVSRLTTTLAYAELVANEYLNSKDRSGYYIADLNYNPPLARSVVENTDSSAPFQPRFVERFSDRVQFISRPSNWRDYPYRFIYGQADPSILDHQRWRQCSLDALGRRDFDLLTLDSYEGDDQILTEYLLSATLPRRGIYAHPDELLITMGAQNALWLCAMLFLNAETNAVIENPCYPGLRSVLSARKTNIAAIDVDQEGLSPKKLPQNVDAVFVTPSHQSPTNVSMSEKRKLELLALAKERDFLIVEDDYEYEINQMNRPIPALKSMDNDGRVVYIGSFSKTLFPGLRIGYLVANREIIKEARALRSLEMRQPPSHTQRAVAYFQSLGYFDSQLNRMASHFAKRRTAMKEAIEKFGLVYGSPPEAGGTSFWMRAPQGVDTDVLAISLRQKGVLIEPGSAFFGPESGANQFYRLGYSSIELSNIYKGVNLIADEISSK